MSDNQYFVPVENVELKNVVEHLINKSTEVIVKIANSHIKSTFLPSSRGTMAVVNKSQSPYSRQQIICNFRFKGDQYFFKSSAHSDEKIIFIDIPEKIFKLQRRNNFRINIPPAMPQTASIAELPNAKGVLCRNVSLGGCLISIKTTAKPIEFKTNDIISVSLGLFEFQEKNLECMVRFIEIKPEVTMLGLQFLELTSEQSSDLQKTLIKIDRYLRGKDEI